MKFIFSTTLLIFLLSTLSRTANSHEGHDHIPGAQAGPHGGVMHGTKSLDWELIQDSKIKLYPFTMNTASKEPKPVSPSEIKMTASLKVHNGKKPKVQSAKLESTHEFFSLTIENNKHPITLEIHFEYQGKKEKIQFSIDPQE